MTKEFKTALLPFLFDEEETLNFDENSKEVIRKLEKTFNVKAKDTPCVISPKSIGIEIEVKFKYYFPELHKKHFTDYKYYKNLGYSEKKTIEQEIVEHEKLLQEQLYKTIECGIPKGMDKYWEFAFNPSYDLSLICKQVDILNQTGLLPEGDHSLHINIGDIKLKPNLYWILNILELSFCTKQRIENGFSSNYISKSASWGRKGDGGILTKNLNDLIDSEEGVELRSLNFNGNANKLSEILNTLNYFLIEDRKEIISQLKREMINLGLPDSNWGKPHDNPEVWKKYIENFEYLYNFLKNIKTW